MPGVDSVIKDLPAKPDTLPAGADRLCLFCILRHSGAQETVLKSVLSLNHYLVRVP